MTSKGIVPESWLTWMKKEEERTGLPAGTLSSLVQQETGFQQRFIDDPSAAHYGGDKPKSSARGLGGILAGTAKDPGYGVKPLQDWSVPEQLRFMADYTSARSKKAGSLEAGLAAYGEGPKYGAQVMARLGKTPSVKEQDAPAVVAQQAVVPNAPVQVAEAPQEAPPMRYNPAMAEADLVDPNMGWNGGQMAAASQFSPASFNFGFSNPLNPEVLARAMQPNFAAFNGWGRQRAA